jgi:ABC-type Zn2+ transport system substrate-binding protein/surface adhesin
LIIKSSFDNRERQRMEANLTPSHHHRGQPAIGLSTADQLAAQSAVRIAEVEARENAPAAREQKVQIFEARLAEQQRALRQGLEKL